MTEKAKDLEKPTLTQKESIVGPEENATYVYGPIPLSAWLIIVTELCERLAFYGASLMFSPYMLTTLKFDTVQTTAISRGFLFFAYFTVIFGAIIADGYIGKFKAIVYSAIWYTIGLIILSATASPASIAAGAGRGGFITATYLFIAFGMGGIKSNVSAFTATQIPKEDIPTGKPNEYYGYNLTVERVFRFFYWSINFGAFFGQLICPIIYQTTNNYGAAFGFPSAMFVVGIIVFITGRSRYVDTPIVTNPIVKTVKCLKYAISHKKSNPNAVHWLDNAKVSDKTSVEWDHKFVDDLKHTLKACKVFLFYIVYWALYNNMADSFIIQGMHMQRPSWLTAEQLNLVNSLALIAFLPLFDYIVFPAIHKMGINLGPLRRICIGFFLCCMSMTVCAILQSRVYATGPYFDFTNLPPGIEKSKIPELQNEISIWYQVIVYLLMAVSEIFASVSGLEFAFKYASEELKSFVMALFLFTNCGGSLIGMILALWSTDPNYTWLFTGEAVAMGIVAIIFTFFYFNKDEE